MVGLMWVIFWIVKKVEFIYIIIVIFNIFSVDKGVIKIIIFLFVI